MFREPTVFILGAGASYAYGFPLGEGLISAIKHYHSSDEFKRLCRELCLEHDLLNEFCHDLEVARPLSLDLFLDNRRADFDQIGKLAIAYCLIGQEMESRTRDPSQATEGWYHLLANYLGKYKRDLTENRLSIITFNYDRSLEYMLFKCLSARFKLTSDEAAEAVRSLNIHHVYGKLGSLPWEKDGGFTRPYTNEATALELRNTAEGIRLIHELNPKAGELGAIREALKGAKHVFMFGCAFHEENLKVLGFNPTNQNSIRNDLPIHATCYKVPGPELNRIKRLYAYFDLNDTKVHEMMLHHEMFYRIATS